MPNLLSVETMSLKDKSKEELLQEIKKLQEELLSKDLQIEELSERLTGFQIRQDDTLISSSMPYQSLAPDGKFLYVNEAWSILLGYSAEDIAGKNFGDIILPELYEKFCEKFEEFKNEGIIIDAELILLAKSGKEIAVKIDGRFVKDEIGNYLHTHCILKDVTTEYKLRTELERREILFSNTFDSLALGVGLYSKDGFLFQSNNRFAEILGYSIEEIKDVSFRQFAVDTDELDSFTEELRSLAMNPKKTLSFEKRNIRKDKQIIWVKMHISVSVNSEGDFEHFNVVLEDITKQKEQEKSLELFKAVIDHANYGVVICTQDREVVFSNQYFGDCHGLSVEESIGKTIDIYHSQSQLEDAYNMFEEMAKDKAHTPRLVWHAKKNGDEFPMLMNGGIVQSNGETYITVSALDISELYSQSIELEENRAKYSAIISQSIDCIYIADAETLQILEANQSLLNLTGYSEDEIKKLTIKDLVYSVDPDFVKSNLQKLLVDKSIKLDLIYYLKKSGEKIAVEVNANLIQVREKFYISGLVRDISEKIRIENELRERENFIRSITDNVPVVIFLFNFKQKRTIYANSQLNKQLGYTMEDLAERQSDMLLDIIHPDDVFRLRTDFSFENFSQKSVYSEFRIKHKKGSYIWFSAVGTELKIGETTHLLGFAQNIDEKRRYSQALIDSERMYRILAESLPDTIMRFDKNMRHLYVSENVTKVVDIKAKDMFNKTHAELGFPEEMVEFWERKIRKVFETGKAGDYEFTIDSKAGLAVIDWRLLPEFDDKGEVESVLAIARIINDLRNTERDYQRLFNELNAGFAVHEIILDNAGNPIDYRFIVVNKAFEKMTGLFQEDIKGKTVKEILPGTEDYWIQTYGEVALTGKTTQIENYSADLDRYYEVTAYSPLKYQFATIIEDITEKKKIRNRIKEQEEKYRLIVENQSDMVLKLDRNYKILYANPNFTQALNLEERDILSKNFLEVIPEENRSCFVEVLNEVANKDKEIATKECKKSDEDLWINWTIKAVKNDLGKLEYLIAVGHDISEIKKVQQKIQELNMELEEKVIQRTHQLQNVVNQLQKENEEHKKTKMQLEVAKTQIEKALNEEKELSQLKTRFISNGIARI